MGVLRVVVREATVAGAPSTNASLSGTPGALPVEYCDLKYAGLWEGPIPDQGQQSLAAIWSLVAFAAVFVALRFYAKIWRLGALWWDDWVALVAWICFLMDAIFSQIAIGLGLGKYPCDVNPRNFPKIALEGENLGSTFGMLAVVWSKTAFAITLLRLTDGKTKKFVWFVIVSMNIIMIMEAITVWAKCDPVEKTWNKMIPGTCWDMHAVNIYGATAGSYSGVCDILLALLPWKLVWGLRMQKKEKIGVAIAMSMGVFAGATAFVKSEKIFVLGTKNFTYTSCELLVWAAAEIGTTIMASCIPVLRVFFREVHEITSSRSRGPKGGYRRNYGDQSQDSTSGSLSRSPNLANTAARMPRPKTIGSQPIKLALHETVSDVLDSPMFLGEHVRARDDSGSKRGILEEKKGTTDHVRSPSAESSNTIVRTQEYAVEYHDVVRQQDGGNKSKRSSRRRDGDIPISRYAL